MNESVINNTLSTKTILEADNLKCVRNEQIIFEEISFRLNAGGVLRIKGPNGSGKTSLLRILCGFILPETGEVRWNGSVITDDLYNYTNDINYVGHSNGLKSELTALENLNVALQLTFAQQDTSITKILSRMCMSDFFDIPVRKLSSGQCRRVALSRLLLSRACIWLLDEPFTTLDDEGRQLIRELIAHHAETGGITIIVSHEPVLFPGDKLQEITL
jgi:heme exporter protein A